ncbi:MAG: hypothetical protein ACI397_05500 [Paludibacteraceae bacterium]
MVLLSSCVKTADGVLTEQDVQETVAAVMAAKPEADSARVARGVAQAAALWQAQDGTAEEFKAFAVAQVAANDMERAALMEQLSRIWERCYESADMLSVELLKPTQLTNAATPGKPDWIMSAYSPMAHFSDDMFANKMAFLTILNFPHYTLAEKNTLGGEWTRFEWAAARMGDMFTTRVPARVEQEVAQAYADAENYIADYNIYMGSLLTEDGRRLWDEDVVLLSHWNLRDELKANYGKDTLSQERQEMIFRVMQRIIDQSIPKAVINAPCDWKPYSNTCAQPNREPDTRYERILGHFHAYQQVDAYCPQAPTAIIRNFEESIEMPLEQVDSLFRSLLSAPEVAAVGKRIEQRLGRGLRPYDIWYDGFKTRATLDQDALTEQTRRRYPDAEAFRRDMPRMLQTMGFAPEKAREICSHIVVEPARGSGHAWPALGRQEPARLRTRIGQGGMDYKGYNIAVHEFGHNVEQVLDLYDIDYYTLAGVPNTAFTEASAFLFQARDLELLEDKNSPSKTLSNSPLKGENSSLPLREGQGGSKSPSKGDVEGLDLDIFWSMYEIIGVSLVDMQMWQWLYAHPEADAAALREATIGIAKEVWNQYYEPVLGEHDCTLLAIYSHMVDVPMYLPNYPIGNIVQFQLSQHLRQCPTPQAWAEEYTRIYQQGRLTPNHWLLQAVGATPSIDSMLEAVRKALQ